MWRLETTQVKGQIVALSARNLGKHSSYRITQPEALEIFIRSAKVCDVNINCHGAFSGPERSGEAVGSLRFCNIADNS